jgi:hypothetical protein
VAKARESKLLPTPTPSSEAASSEAASPEAASPEPPPSRTTLAKSLRRLENRDL